MGSILQSDLLNTACEVESHVVLKGKGHLGCNCYGGGRLCIVLGQGMQACLLRRCVCLQQTHVSQLANQILPTCCNAMVNHPDSVAVDGGLCGVELVSLQEAS